MSRSILTILTICGLFLFLSSCATFEAHYGSEKAFWNKSQDQSDGQLEHRFYLIGDAGNAGLNQSLDHFKNLKGNLDKEGENSTLLFLGDNIYPHGMPSGENENSALAAHRLDAQLELATKFKGTTIFIPGNHDYYSDGVSGLKRQEEYVNKRLESRGAFLPKNGCPIEKVDISDDLVLLIIDSQWFLENWDKHPTKNDDCEIKTREQFFIEYESLIKKNTSKTTIVAVHHPMFSGGPHGGQFKFSLLETASNLLRKTSGASPQDQLNPLFMELKKRLITLSQYGERVIFTSGHEHLLQYVRRDNIPQIISGSGSKTVASRNIKGNEFSYGSLGYTKLDIYKNGTSKVFFYGSKSDSDSLLYATEIYKKVKRKSLSSYTTQFKDTVESSVYTQEEVNKTAVYKWLWGKHYRNYYGRTVKAKTVMLDTLLGGLKPVRKGGGHQSNSLRLEDKHGREYMMRALRKNPLRFMQSGIFKDQYIEGQYDETYTEGLLADVFTAAHPYAPLTVGPLLDAIDIYHPNTRLYYIPKQAALEHFNSEFGDELYYFEERAASGHGDLKIFGFNDKVISSDDMMNNIRKSDDHYLDESTYIRARLLDMVIGDWDRHKDQWRWAQIKDGKEKVYKPVPRDRDQAFSKYDGFLMEFTTRIIPAAKKLQVYDEEFRSLKWFNTNPFPLDKALINTVDLQDWLDQARIIQSNVTEGIIDNALGQMPVEVQDSALADIKQIMLFRINNLDKTAKAYHDYLSKYPIVKGNDKDNYFKIERLSNGSTSVKIYNIKDGEIGTKSFEKVYDADLTKEIWMYGLDDKDVFEVTGSPKKAILLRLIGGQNKDTYKIQQGKKVVVYDFKDKKNDFETKKGRLKLSNDYETNLYDYKKNKYSQNQLIPMIGFNPDDGFRLGINNVFTIYGFERNPFTTRHTLNAHYYFATNGFDIAYHLELANIFRKWNFLLETGATSPNYSVNFYGFGNETINHEDEFGEDFHRVRTSAYLFYPKLKWVGRMGSLLELGALAEGIELENTEGRFISTIPEMEEDRQYYLGAKSKFAYENYDNNAFPTMGMGFEVEAGWKTNTNNTYDDNIFIKPALNINYKLTSNGKLVLATKLKGHVVWGDEIAFYNAASIGGKDGLRGYRNQRFTGNKSFYQNSDIRYNIKEVKTGLMPLQMAVFGGFDYGRVWLDGEESNDWKTSYGGGFALVGAEMINLNASLFTSVDGMYFVFGLGFDF